MSGNQQGSLSDEEVAWLKSVKMSKRAAVVRDHILSHGSITTTTLRDEYDYDHPPRAGRDLKDAGVGVASRMVVIDGKRMAEYYFTGSADKNAAGRVIIPKPFSDKLKKEHEYVCAICSGVFAGRELQADHRVPFAIGGDQPEFEIEDFMPLCASCNRAKSWSCEHCPNWETKSIETCNGCFWSHPEGYEHVETRSERRLSITYQSDEVHAYDHLDALAKTAATPIQEMAKVILSDF